MSKRSNDELMALHWAAKPVPKSDEMRLLRCIQAHYANEEAAKAQAEWDAAKRKA